MSVQAITPDADTGALLAGAQFADAYTLTIDDPSLDARGAAERMFATRPPWISGLMAVRNVVVSPFGLKTSASRTGGKRDVVGFFPVISQTPNRIVTGFDDKHLDFRVVVDIAPAEVTRCVRATTLVRTHNALGRIYLATVLPFHRLIVPSMMRQLLRERQRKSGAA